MDHLCFALAEVGSSHSLPLQDRNNLYLCPSLSIAFSQAKFEDTDPWHAHIYHYVAQPPHFHFLLHLLPPVCL